MESWLKISEWLTENPWMSALSFFLALLGIILAIIFFIRGRRTKEPRYTIRSTNLMRDFTSSLAALEMMYAGERISNLTATKLAFWNNGKDTINGGDIASADPLMVKVNDGYKILDSNVLYVKNAANQFSINHSDDGSHVLIQFDYLDADEGGVIQLLHTGKSSDDIEVCGTIKGAGKPNRRSIPMLKNLPFPLPSSLAVSRSSIPLKAKRWIFAVFTFIVPVIVGVSMFLTPESPPSNPSILTKGIAFAIILLMYWGWGFYALKRRIPKGFEIFEEDI